MILAIPARMGQALHGSRPDSAPFDSSQQTTEGELYAGNAQSSSRLTGEPVAYLLGLVIVITGAALALLLALTRMSAFPQATQHQRSLKKTRGDPGSSWKARSRNGLTSLSLELATSPAFF